MFKKAFHCLSVALAASAVYAGPTGPVSSVIQETPGVVRDGRFFTGLHNSTAVLSTDFEAPQWDLDASVCGDEFVAGCPAMGGFANVCVPKNHAASLNCCPDDPNEETGWSMSPSSQHCREPSIRNVHPFAGSQHLRYQYDASYGNPPGCNGFGSACRQRAITSQSPVAEVSKTTWSYEIACSATLGSSLVNVIGTDTGMGSVYFQGYVYWYYLGGIYTYDFINSTFVFGGYWSDNSPDYANHTAVFDPCTNTQTFSYDGVVYFQFSYGWTPPNGDPGDPFPNSPGMGVDSAFYTTDHFGETWDIDNHFITYEPCPDACCDGTTGTCADGVDVADCTGPSFTWYENQYCEAVECTRDTGACCDSSPGAGGPGPEGACTDGTFPEDCTGAYHTWSKLALCADVTCNEVTGACCNTLEGSCTDGLLQAECSGPQRVWSVEQLCADVACDAVLGACCDGDTFGSCTETTQAGCACAKCSWTKLATCGSVECTHEAIPTVSEWGLVVLTLLMLTGAKVYFGRRQAIA